MCTSRAPYFGGDPCPGVEKHLAAQVKCVDPHLVGGLVADGSDLAMTCPPGESIGKILFASYGTPTGDLSLFQSGWCESTYSTDVVKTLCLNEPFCTIPVNAGQFSDPCVGTDKSLAVEARCWATSPPTPDANSISGTADEHDTLVLECPSPDFVIGSINFASYGTPGGNSTDGFTSTWCDAQTTVPIVSDLCIGQPI
ncbi:hypothetical protein ACHHYP_06746, partial [Achlya hypogyna]